MPSTMYAELSELGNGDNKNMAALARQAIGEYLARRHAQ